MGRRKNNRGRVNKNSKNAKQRGQSKFVTQAEHAKQDAAKLRGKQEALRENEFVSVGYSGGKKGKKNRMRGMESIDGGMVVGLVNSGNTCYFNAALQALGSSGYMLRAMRRLKRAGRGGEGGGGSEEQGEGAGGGGGPLCRVFRETLTRVGGGGGGGGGALRPTGLLTQVRKVAPQFRGNHQQDSHEFMVCCLANCQEEEEAAWQRQWRQDRTRRRRARRSAPTGSGDHDHGTQHLDTAADEEDDSPTAVPPQHHQHKDRADSEDDLNGDGDDAEPAPAPEAGFVVSSFGSQICSIVTCDTCRTRNFRFDDALNVSLHIPREMHNNNDGWGGGFYTGRKKKRWQKRSTGPDIGMICQGTDETEIANLLNSQSKLSKKNKRKLKKRLRQLKMQREQDAAFNNDSNSNSNNNNNNNNNNKENNNNDNSNSTATAPSADAVKALIVHPKPPFPPTPTDDANPASESGDGEDVDTNKDFEPSDKATTPIAGEEADANISGGGDPAAADTAARDSKDDNGSDDEGGDDDDEDNDEEEEEEGDDEADLEPAEETANDEAIAKMLQAAEEGGDGGDGADDSEPEFHEMPELAKKEQLEQWDRLFVCPPAPPAVDVTAATCTLEQCLDAFTTAEDLLAAEGNGYRCAVCAECSTPIESASVAAAPATSGSHTDGPVIVSLPSKKKEQEESDSLGPPMVNAKRRLLLWTAPPVLVLHLKRLQAFTKISKEVTFGEVLNLTPFVLRPSDEFADVVYGGSGQADDEMLPPGVRIPDKSYAERTVGVEGADPTALGNAAVDPTEAVPQEGDAAAVGMTTTTRLNEEHPLYMYRLCAVVVHQGGSHGGHYVAYMARDLPAPSADPQPAASATDTEEASGQKEASEEDKKVEASGSDANPGSDGHSHSSSNTTENDDGNASQKAGTGKEKVEEEEEEEEAVDSDAPTTTTATATTTVTATTDEEQEAEYKAGPQPQSNPPLGDQRNWYFASDSHVRRCSLNEVLNAEAYIVVYERFDVSAPAP